MYDDGANGNDTANGERTGITHEHLCRIGIIPQESYHRSHESTYKDHKFLAARDIHDIQIRCILDMARHIGQYAQCHTNHGRVAGTHTVHSVVEISTIAHCRNHDDCHHNEENPTGCFLVLAAEGHHLGIVEVVVLQEGDGCLERFLGFTLVLHHHLLTLTLH